MRTANTLEDTYASETRQWTVKVWDGNSTSEFLRRGTYEEVYNSLAGYPPSYIWSIQ